MPARALRHSATTVIQTEKGAVSQKKMNARKGIKTNAGLALLAACFRQKKMNARKGIKTTCHIGACRICCKVRRR